MDVTSLIIQIVSGAIGGNGLAEHRFGTLRRLLGPSQTGPRDRSDTWDKTGNREIGCGAETRPTCLIAAISYAC